MTRVKNQRKLFGERLEQLMQGKEICEENLEWNLKRMEVGYADLVEPIVIPDKLYRYRPGNKYTLLEINDGIEGCIYMSSRDEFNDIYDAYPYFDESQDLNSYAGAHEYLIYLAENDPDRFEKTGLDLETWKKAIRDNIDAQMLRVACFSERHDIIPMWYFYANEYKGVCIEYDMTGLKEKFKPDGDKQLLPVIYTNKMGKYIAKRYTGRKEDIFINAVLKGSSWSNEYEWRLLKYLGDAENAGNNIYNLPISKIYYIENIISEVLLEWLEKKVPEEKRCPLIITRAGLRSK